MKFRRKDSFFYKMTRRYEKMCYDNCNEILVTTEKLKDIIRKHYDVSPDKMHIIPNGVDCLFYKPLNKNKKNRLIYTGNIGHAQDLEKVILAVKKINEQQNSPIDFYLVGDGDIRHRLQSFVKRNNLDNHIIFTGLVNREEVPELLCESMIGVAPLKNLEILEYAIPTKSYEYMSCGIPFLATGRGEIKNIAELSGAGIVADNDVDSIFDKINFLINNPDVRYEMGKKGREFVQKYYDRKIIAQNLLDIVNS